MPEIRSYSRGRLRVAPRVLATRPVMTSLGAIAPVARTPRNRWRYLAPLALVAAMVATVLVITAGLGTSSHPRAPAHRTDSAVTAHAAPRKSFYVVREGDTLSTISVKTGISVPSLESLNPSVDPNALRMGQRLRLR